jgi:hypothetical protein
LARIPFLGKRGTSKPQGATSAVPLDDVMAMLNAQQNVRDYRGGNRTPSYLPTPQEWNTDPFGPGFRIRPEAINNLRNDTGRPDPRIYEYPIAWNLRTEQQRLIPWSTLRSASLAPLVRPIITKRQKDLTSLSWDVTITRGAIEKAAKSALGTAAAADALQDKFAGDIERVSQFWKYPDLEQGYTFRDWLWQLAEEQLTLDAMAISPRVTYGGDTFGFRILDGSTIKPMLDPTGARPMPPAPAYQQILYGFPRGEWTADLNDNGDVEGYPADQLIYRRRAVRTFSPYGMSPVEESLADLDLFLKRHGWMRAEYTEGTLAEAYLKSPQDLIWSPQQLLEYERDLNDSVSGSTQERHRMRMLPPGVDPVITGDTAERYKPEYDVYVVALVATHFGEHPEELGFTIGRNQLSGSGATESARQTSAESGLFPDARYYAQLITHLSREYLGLPRECEFKFLDIESEDPTQDDAIAVAQIADGRKTLNEERDRLGFPRYDNPLADEPMIITATSAMTLDQIASQVLNPAVNPASPVTSDSSGTGLAGPVNGSKPGSSSAEPDASQAKAKPAEAVHVSSDGAPGNTSAVRSPKAADSERSAAIGLAQAELNCYRRYIGKRDVISREFEFSADAVLVKSLAEPGELLAETYLFKDVRPAEHVAAAAKVFAQLSENFPPEAIEWIHRARWDKQQVPTDQVDMDEESSWAAAHEPDQVDRLARRFADGKKIKPAILIREPGNRRLITVDGHHRVLGAVKAQVAVPAFVGTIEPADLQAALETHTMQSGHSGSDKKMQVVPDVTKAGPKGYEHGGKRVGVIGARSNDAGSLADLVQRDGHANTADAGLAAAVVGELHTRGVPAQHERILVGGDYRSRIYDVSRANHRAGLKN